MEGNRNGELQSELLREILAQLLASNAKADEALRFASESNAKADASLALSREANRSSERTLGALERVEQRLGGVEQRLDTLSDSVATGFSALRAATQDGLELLARADARQA